jgi:alanine racemase
MNNHVSVLEISKNALEHNLKYLKNKLHQKTKILAVVKAFGYGSDANKVAYFLKDKINYFAVAYTHEGISLRKAKIPTPVLVLHPQIQNLDEIISNQLEPSIYNLKTLNAFIKLAEEKEIEAYPIHLKFNTGLNRFGFSKVNIPKIMEIICNSKHVKIKSILSHLASSEDSNERQFTLNQIQNFKEIITQVYDYIEYTPMAHILNTSGVINYPEAQFNMVRIGIGLYGFGNNKKETSQLKNTHILKSIISQIHIVKKGETVGYNRTFKASKDTTIATIPIGHADGLSRRLGNGNGYITIQNQSAPIVGNVCMDMIMVDITGIECSEGDPVFIFKTQKDIVTISSISETSSYEILTLTSQRIKRSLI